MRLNLKQYLDIDRNEYQESFLGVKTAGAYLTPSCANCLEILEPQPPGTPTASPKPVAGKLYLYLI
jgi:hypothetical protein